MCNSVSYWLNAGFNEAPPRNVAQDAAPVSLIAARLKRLTRYWQSRFDAVAPDLAKKFIDSTMTASELSLQSALKKTGFTVTFAMTPPVRDIFNASVQANTALITNIPAQMMSDISGDVMRSVSQGFKRDELMQQLQERYGMTRRRAELIARDQSNKANSAINSARQQQLGITHGIWQHSHAGKEPRQSHVAANNTPFDLRKGLYLDGEWVLPGQAINCRCTWRPVIPGLEGIS